MKVDISADTVCVIRDNIKIIKYEYNFVRYPLFHCSFDYLYEFLKLFTHLALKWPLQKQFRLGFYLYNFYTNPLQLLIQNLLFPERVFTWHLLEG